MLALTEVRLGSAEAAPAVLSGGPAPTAHPRSVRRRWAGALLVGAAALIISAALFGSRAGIVQLAYIPVTTCVGILLFRYDPPRYVAYSLWLWLLTSFVRRLVDHQLGWHPANPLLAAPLFVSAISGVTLVRHARRLTTRTLVPFLVAAMGIVYGYAVGLARVGPVAASYAMLLWLTPILFGLHLAVHRRCEPTLDAAFARAVLAGVLAVGIYGMYQYVSPPSWDVYWMVNSDMRSIGRPEPYGVRVFGTLNSPAPFAVLMMGGVLLLLADRSKLRWPAVACGFVGLLLSSVRAAWGGWVIGLAGYGLHLRGSGRFRLAVILGALALGVVPLLSIAPVATLIERRAETFTDLREDASARARMDFHREMAAAVARNPVGTGLGSTGGAVHLNGDEGLTDFDSGALEPFHVLGWMGGLAYAAAVLWLSATLAVTGTRPGDGLGAALGGVALAVLSVNVAFNSLTGVGGMLFWGALGLLAARRRQRATLRWAAS
jgi:hypothetical protein